MTPPLAPCAGRGAAPAPRGADNKVDLGRNWRRVQAWRITRSDVEARVRPPEAPPRAAPSEAPVFTSAGWTIRVRHVAVDSPAPFTARPAGGLIELIINADHALYERHGLPFDPSAPQPALEALILAWALQEVELPHEQARELAAELRLDVGRRLRSIVRDA